MAILVPELNFGKVEARRVTLNGYNFSKVETSWIINFGKVKARRVTLNGYKLFQS